MRLDLLRKLRLDRAFFELQPRDLFTRRPSESRITLGLLATGAIQDFASVEHKRGLYPSGLHQGKFHR